MSAFVELLWPQSLLRRARMTTEVTVRHLPAALVLIAVLALAAHEVRVRYAGGTRQRL